MAVETDLDWLSFQKGLRSAEDDFEILGIVSRMRAITVEEGITDELIETAKSALMALKGKTMGKYDRV